MEVNLFVCIHKGTLLKWFLQQRNEPAELLLFCEISEHKGIRPVNVIHVCFQSAPVNLLNKEFPLNFDWLA